MNLYLKIINEKYKSYVEQLTDLKAILHSKRANIYYLEKCRVLYLTEESVEKQYSLSKTIEYVTC